MAIWVNNVYKAGVWQDYLRVALKQLNIPVSSCVASCVPESSCSWLFVGVVWREVSKEDRGANSQDAHRCRSGFAKP
jgi:hypothetical protein